MRTAVNVKTQKEWDIVSDKLGYTWTMAKWQNEDTSIFLDENSIASKDWCIGRGYKVISFDRFIGKKADKYELIVTNKKVIILDKENNTRGIATCHPDDVFDIATGFEIAWSRLKGIEPHKSREDIINEEYGVNDEFKPSNKKPILNDDYNKEMGKVRNLVGLTEDKVNATRQEYINRMSGFPNTIIEEPKFKDLNKLSDVEKRLLAKQLADEILKEIEAKIGKINK